MLRAIAYARVSTIVQATTGISLSAQINKISKHAQSLNMNIYKIFNDIGSAFDNSKSNSDLFKYLNSGINLENTNLIICNVSRFSRSKKYGLMGIKEIVNRGLNIYFIEEKLHINSNNIDDKYTELEIYLNLAEQESITLSNRIKEVKSYGKSIGNYIGGHVPYGIEVYQNDQGIKKYRPNQYQINVIKFVEICRSNNYTAEQLNIIMSKITYFDMDEYPIVLVDDYDIRENNSEPMPFQDIADLLNDYEVYYKYPQNKFTYASIRNMKKIEQLQEYYNGNEDMMFNNFENLSLKRKSDSVLDGLENKFQKVL